MSVDRQGRGRMICHALQDPGQHNMRLSPRKDCKLFMKQKISVSPEETLAISCLEGEAPTVNIWKLSGGSKPEYAMR